MGMRIFAHQKINKFLSIYNTDWDELIREKFSGFEENYKNL
jgi:hypothetical protein